MPQEAWNYANGDAMLPIMTKRQYTSYYDDGVDVGVHVALCEERFNARLVWLEVPRP